MYFRTKHNRKLTGEKENLKGFRLIPYRTVGKSGVMPVFELEKMYIVQKNSGFIIHWSEYVKNRYQNRGCINDHQP